MHRDFRGIWMGRLMRRIEWHTCLKYGLVNRLYALLWGVQLGEGCCFYGRTHFRRVEFSSIVIGDKCRFRSNVDSNFVGINRPCMVSTLSSTAMIDIGPMCGFSGTVIAANKSIQIGANVLCGGNVTISDTDWHGIKSCERRESGLSANIVIEDNVWIGLNAIVLKGVTIGKNTIIGAGSVVNRSLPPNVIAAGQPSRIVRNL